MHWNIEQILWALVLAGHLVLLVVLLGRERARSFPWFTAGIALSAVSLLANHLLHERLTTVAFYWQSYTALALEALLGLLVLIELTRRVFSSGKAGLRLNPRGWLGGVLITVALATAAVWAWGPWPTMQALKAEPAQLPLLIVILTGMKGQLFIALLTVEVALLLRIFGKRFGFGGRSYVQQIALGLSTNALGFLAVQGITDIIKHTVHLTSRQQYERIIHLLTNLENGRIALWCLVLIWWIIWLWRDDPDAPAANELVLVEVPDGGAPLNLAAESIPESSPESETGFNS